MTEQQITRFTRVIDLDNDDNNEIKQVVLPRTSRKYGRFMMILTARSLLSV